MKKYQIIYDENKKLDQAFDNLYNTSDYDIIRKNKLELLVELGELANETKSFKYWSTKNINIENIHEEYADCLIMVLCFFNIMDISLDENFKISKIRYDTVDLIAHLYKLCSEFYYNENKELIKQIFTNFIELGHQLDLDDDKIIEVCLSKINKNFKRFESGF